MSGDPRWSQAHWCVWLHLPAWDPHQVPHPKTWWKVSREHKPVYHQCIWSSRLLHWTNKQQWNCSRQTFGKHWSPNVAENKINSIGLTLQACIVFMLQVGICSLLAEYAWFCRWNLQLVPSLVYMTLHVVWNHIWRCISHHKFHSMNYTILKFRPGSPHVLQEMLRNCADVCVLIENWSEWETGEIQACHSRLSLLWSQTVLPGMWHRYFNHL